MTLTQLNYLIAIADAGLNITQAAQRVFATQPGISKQLKQFEDELGFLVFTRKGKSLDSITAAGAQVIERARSILAEAGNIRALAANLRSDAQGELRIATTHTQARFVLPRAIASLKRRFPEVNVHLMPGGDGEIRELLNNGQVDLAIVSTVGEPPPSDHAIPLFRWRRTIVVPVDHALTKVKSPVLADLAAFPLVSYESSLRPDSSLRRAFEAQDLAPRFACTARDADLIKTYVRAGLGVGVLAEMALLPEDKADLCVLDVGDDVLPVCTSWLLLRNDHLLRDFTTAFITTLSRQIDHHDLRRALIVGEDIQWPAPPQWAVA